jgi:nucleolar protein 12
VAIRVPQTFLPSQQAREPRQPPRAQEPTSKLAKRKREEQKAAAAPAAAAKKAKAVANDEELSELEEDSDADEDLEEAYERKLAALGSDDDADDAGAAKAPVVLRPTLTLEDLMDVDGDAAEGTADAGPLVHESVAKSGKVASGKLSKTQAKKAGKLPVWVPEGETQEQRDSRTLFIGNLSAELAKDKVRRLPLSGVPEIADC